MKKISTLLLALMLIFSLTACASTPSEDLEDVAPVEDDVLENDEGNVEDVSNVDETSQNWYDFADIFTLTYYGYTEADEAVAFVMTEDESFAVLVIANTDTMESASFVGEMTFSEESGTYTITDETSGLSLTFAAEFSEDSISLDMGDLGTVIVVPCEQSEAFDLLNDIEVATTAVA